MSTVDAPANTKYPTRIVCDEIASLYRSLVALCAGAGIAAAIMAWTTPGFSVSATLFLVFMVLAVVTRLVYHVCTFIAAARTEDGHYRP